ncbi:MAG: shikimate dehydrogenase [Rothia sp.]|uniref:shikimate dehydrogenase n=1 Tax=Rothia sp. (in: high G+C Gram-positive bacteria) TaxID=1885016 RepID=UPI001CAC4DD0|nr:shikimate dehydrogenase [Rothia sp. (in: high G+C Gram-positive bacteria)]MBF1676515.1 shikimate dehydrogenase [Rothia sp. (in: high G+C Gram-positive bacteria)]
MKTEPYREAPYLRRAYVLGHPIAHSLSPALHRAAYAYLGEANLEYDRRDTLPDDLPAIMRGVRHPKGTEDAPYIAGLSVTMPLKTAVIQYCDELSETARVTGAVNTVYPRGERVLGDNTDVIGIVNALRHAGLEPNPERDEPAVIGGGATAISALTALHKLGYRRASVYARSLHKLGSVQKAADRLGVQLSTVALAEFPAEQKARRHNPVISTLPARAADEWASQLSGLKGASATHRPVLLDVAYNPWPSALASVWEASGGAVVSGLEMLLYQAVEQVLLFTDCTLQPAELLGLINAMCAAVGLPSREHLPAPLAE